jgi:hypothetical protein
MMKRTLNIINGLLCLAAFNSAIAQNCKAELFIGRPQCNLVVENTSNSAYKFHWMINGKIYYERSIDFANGEYDVLDICLYVEDTVNACSDTICRMVKGWEKIRYNYYVYKQQLYLNVLSKGSPEVVYTLDYGDKYYQNSYKIGVFKHTYSKPGKYGIRLSQNDTFKVGNTIKRCQAYASDSITIDQGSQCRSFFLTYRDSSIKDSIWLFNRSAGENLRYYWDLGDGSSSTERFPVHTYQSSQKVDICLIIVDTVANCVNTYCDTLSVDSGSYLQVISEVKDPPMQTGLEKNDWRRVSVYPNPFNQSINIILPTTGEGIQWEILGNDGRLLVKGAFNGTTAENHINTDRLESGLYILVLRKEKGTFIQKIVKH